jgi:hypothetical protein
MLVLTDFKVVVIWRFIAIRQEDVGKENTGIVFYFPFPHFPVW